MTPPADPQDLPSPFGRYRIVRPLGQGGMGAVYLVEDLELHRLVALKVPRFRPDDRTDIRERFYREARAAATLNHPHICPIHDVGQVDGICYLTMAYVEGTPLVRVLESGQLPQPQVARLVRQVALALQEAHERGIVHRDLKPANILLNQRQEPVVMDFGVACQLNQPHPRATEEGSLVGTPAYMSPEQVRGDLEAIGPASDVYSLGVILYELLTGQLPVSGPPAAVLGQILFQQPEPPSRLRPGVHPQLEAICLKAMAKPVEQRYASMRDLAAALDDYLHAAEGGPATSSSAARPRWQQWLAGGVLCAALLGVGLFLTFRDRGNGPAPAPRDPLPGETPAAAAPKLDAAAVARAVGKLPAPEPGQVAGRKQPLRDAARAELVGRKPQERVRHARTLVQRGQAEAEDTALRYALLDLASELAAEAGDVATALDTIDKLAQSFVVDTIRLKTNLLTGHASAILAAGSAEELACAVLRLGFEAVAAEACEEARRLVPVARAVVKRVEQDSPEYAAALAYQVAFLEEETERVAAARGSVQPYRETLLRHPEDPEASAAVGRFRCLVRNEWARGTALLARSPDPAVRAVATGELEGPTQVDRQVALADAWWALAERENAETALACRRRARHWYLEALGQNPPAQRGDLARRVTPRIDSVPIRPIVLHISLREFFGEQHLVLSNDGIQHTHNQYGPPHEVRINHLSWAGRVQGFTNAGATRLFPEAVDFSTADIIDPPLYAGGASRPGGPVSFRFQVTPRELRVSVLNPMSSRVNFEFQVTLQADGFHLANRFAGLWHVKLYRWDGTKGKAPLQGWADGPPVHEVQRDRLGFRGYERIGTRPEWRPPLGKLPMDNFALAATSAWEMPAGKYRIETFADDGLRLYLDDRCLIDAWSAARANPRDRVDVSLAAGIHKLRLEFFQGTGWARLRFQVRRIGDS